MDQTNQDSSAYITTGNQQPKGLQEDHLTTRPMGVTIIASLCFLSAAYLALTALKQTVDGTMATNLSSLGGGLGAGFIAVTVTTSILYGFAGWGLWKLRASGRILAVSLFILGLAFSVVRFQLARPARPSNLLTMILSLAIYSGSIGYLLVAPCKWASQFRSESHRNADLARER